MRDLGVVIAAALVSFIFTLSIIGVVNDCTLNESLEQAEQRLDALEQEVGP